MANTKVSKPIVYSVVAAVVILPIAFFLTQPDAPTTTTHTHIASSGSSASAPAQSMFTAADLKAHFPRYHGRVMDAFTPKVASDTPNGATASTAHGPAWTLTGTTTVDGVTSALVENRATNESDFLQVGDEWNGMRVVNVGDEAVLLEGASGQKTRLTFPTTDDTPTKGPNANVARGPIALALPVTGTLPPLPVIPPGRNAPLPSLNQTQ